MSSPSPYAACPKCGAREARKVNFTWWGGVLGPNLLTHVECPQCKTQYNGKTGRSNKNGIIIYFAVFTAIGLVALFFLLLLMILAQQG
ncbi:MAG: hypothetical protein LBL59_08240 [Xanthomonadaceae bacterium]|jgi:hypothetical protein|nr:hypothetical protein [Xanthomonadaceae bacterium]